MSRWFNGDHRGGRSRIQSRALVLLAFVSSERALILLVSGERVNDALALGQETPEGGPGLSELRFIACHAGAHGYIFLIRDHLF
jgi:hypothetical protein